MKVILLQDIPKVGKKDQVVDAKSGHARNFLIPNGLAIEATKDNLKKLSTRQEQAAETAAYEKAQAESLGNILSDATITIGAKVGNGNKLFGAITNKEIAEEIEKQLKVSIDRRKIVLDEKIKDLGARKILVKLHSEVKVELKVNIVAAD